jgi:hypothetical protein
MAAHCSWRRSEETLAADVFVEHGRTKVMLTGAADQYMGSALFYMLNQLPPANPPVPS